MFFIPYQVHFTSMEIEKSLSVGEPPLKEVTVWVRRARRARRAGVVVLLGTPPLHFKPPQM